MAETLEATFRIVTPMFIGDAHQAPEDGVRPPSVKGALRFWWRALNWGRMREKVSCDEAALQILHDEEVRLLGGSAEQGGQGSFLLSVASALLTNQRTETVHPEFKKYDAARYLGYGLMVPFSSAKQGTTAGQLLRGCIDENQSFTVSLHFRSTPEPTIIEALMAFGLLGGIGSRSRHGMGSIALETLRSGKDELFQAPTDSKTLRDKIEGVMRGVIRLPQLPPFSAFSEHSRIDLLCEGKSTFDALNVLGRSQLMYRSWGRGGIVLGKPSEKRFLADHDWSKGTRPSGFHPKRVVFGLPHNYGKGTAMEIAPADHNRRSSPLLLHIHPLSTKTSAGVSVFLPATFLPTGEQINAGGTHVPASIDWSDITEFLDGKDAAGALRFPGRLPV